MKKLSNLLTSFEVRETISVTIFLSPQRYRCIDIYISTYLYREIKIQIDNMEIYLIICIMSLIILIILIIFFNNFLQRTLRSFRNEIIGLILIRTMVKLAKITQHLYHGLLMDVLNSLALIPILKVKSKSEKLSILPRVTHY